jgi:hypothetical protein
MSATTKANSPNKKYKINSKINSINKYNKISEINGKYHVNNNGNEWE